MLKKFLKEEKAQGSIEYILIAGGTIVAAMLILMSYQRMGRGAATQIENATQVATNATSEAIQNITANATA